MSTHLCLADNQTAQAQWPTPRPVSAFLAGRANRSREHTHTQRRLLGLVSTREKLKTIVGYTHLPENMSKALAISKIVECATSKVLSLLVFFLQILFLLKYAGFSPWGRRVCWGGEHRCFQSLVTRRRRSLTRDRPAFRARADEWVQRSWFTTWITIR